MSVPSFVTKRSYSVPPGLLRQPRRRWYQRLLASTSVTAMRGWGRIKSSRKQTGDSRQRFPLFIFALLRPLQFSLPLPSRLQDAPPPLIRQKRRRSDGLHRDLDFPTRVGWANRQFELQDADAVNPGLDHDAFHFFS